MVLVALKNPSVLCLIPTEIKKIPTKLRVSESERLELSLVKANDSQTIHERVKGGFHLHLLVFPCVPFCSLEFHS